jgi:NAD-dependent SIR2 family protein deacetylase
VVKHVLTVKAEQLSRSKEKDNTPCGYLQVSHWEEAHGFRGDSSWELPRQVVHCDAEARPGYKTMLAHEYKDSPTVLQAKVDILARMMEASQNCVIYSGAGISTNSGISDYATRSGATTDHRRPHLRSPYEAQPTYAHRALVAMYEGRFIKYWIQQNHDGLPQKAGLPQHAINEIHGAWYDPSNPVVAMNGNLRSDLFQDMLRWEHQADLTLSVGTSMCGMNSDRVFTTVSRKAQILFQKGKLQKDVSSSPPIGGVIINRQQTQHDNMSCLRIYADLDEVMALLLISLGLKKRANECSVAMQSPYCDTISATEDVFRVPYTVGGIRQVDGNNCTTLDLREGSKVRVTGGPYEGDYGEVLGKNKEGHYRIQFRHLVGITKRPFTSVLGKWWIEAAASGHIEKIPVVNVR